MRRGVTVRSGLYTIVFLHWYVVVYCCYRLYRTHTGLRTAKPYTVHSLLLIAHEPRRPLVAHESRRVVARALPRTHAEAALGRYVRLHVRLSGRTAEALGLCAVRSLSSPRPSVSLQCRGEEGGEVLGHLERIDSDVDRGNALGRTLLAW